MTDTALPAPAHPALAEEAPTPTFGRRGRLEPELELEEVRATSSLDALRAELALEVASVTLEVSGRPGYAVRFDPNITYDEVVAWRKRAKDTKNPTGVNELRFACIILANKCEAVIRQGEEVVVGSGETLTFRSPEFHELLEATSSIDAVRRFYGRDLLVTNVAGTLLGEAGLGEDVATVGDELEPDPTAR